jgi:hypothetical protein
MRLTGYERREIHKELHLASLKVKDHLEDIGVEERIILKCIFEE